MRAIKNNFRGVSNVIGALMLTLIVVGAATSFALFVSQRQEMQQEAELAKTRKALENLEVVNIKLNATCLNFSVFNSGASEVKISTIRINQGVWLNKTQVNQTKILRYDTMPFNTSNFTELRFEDYNPQSNKPLTIELITTLGNNFEKTFYPPTSVIKLTTDSEWNNSNSSYDDFLILDGSLSDHPDEDAYIKNWKWNLTQISPLGSTLPEISGRIVRAPKAIMTDKWNITLTVEDNYGMLGTSTVDYKH
jgi:hypothetical protein